MTKFQKICFYIWQCSKDFTWYHIWILKYIDITLYKNLFLISLQTKLWIFLASFTELFFIQSLSLSYSNLFYSLCALCSAIQLSKSTSLLSLSFFDSVFHLHILFNDWMELAQIFRHFSLDLLRVIMSFLSHYIRKPSSGW